MRKIKAQRSKDTRLLVALNLLSCSWHPLRIPNFGHGTSVLAPGHRWLSLASYQAGQCHSGLGSSHLSPTNVGRCSRSCGQGTRQYYVMWKPCQSHRLAGLFISSLESLPQLDPSSHSIPYTRVALLPNSSQDRPRYCFLQESSVVPHYPRIRSRLLRSAFKALSILASPHLAPTAVMCSPERTASCPPIVPGSRMPQCCPARDFILLSPLYPAWMLLPLTCPLLVPYPELIFPRVTQFFSLDQPLLLLLPALSSSVGHESGCSSRQGPVGRSLLRSPWHRLKESMFAE